MIDISRSILNSRLNIERIEKYYGSIGQNIPTEIRNVRSKLNNHEIEYNSLETILRPILQAAGVDMNFSGIWPWIFGAAVIIGIPGTAYLILSSLRTKVRQTELEIDAIARGIVPAVTDWPSTITKALPYIGGIAALLFAVTILKK